MNVNIYLPDELGERVKRADLEVSRICQEALTATLDKRKMRSAEPWLTIRDHFASAALLIASQGVAAKLARGFLQDPSKTTDSEFEKELGQSFYDATAYECYRLADSMLLRRDKP